MSSALSTAIIACASAERSATAVQRLEAAGAVWIAGGEWTLTLGDHPGRGGRARHLALIVARALAGDPTAAATLTATLTKPLSDAGAVLTATLEAYLDAGGSVESCARTLFVHPNTVRYRLKRITEITGRDPTNPRDAYVLRVATTVGRLTHYRNKT